MDRILQASRQAVLQQCGRWYRTHTSSAAACTATHSTHEPPLHTNGALGAKASPAGHGSVGPHLPTLPFQRSSVPVTVVRCAHACGRLRVADCNAGKERETSNDTATNIPCACFVMRKFCCRAPVSELKLQAPSAASTAASQALLQQICSLLQLPDAQGLVVWGRVGPRVTYPALPHEWQAVQQQWERVHAPLQQQEEPQHEPQQGQERPAVQAGSGDGRMEGQSVLGHLSGGTSVLVKPAGQSQQTSATVLQHGQQGQHTEHAQQQQQQQQEEEEATEQPWPQQEQPGDDGPSSVVLGAARQASASTLLGEPQPPKKRLHTAGEGAAPPADEAGRWALQQQEWTGLTVLHAEDQTPNVPTLP